MKNILSSSLLLMAVAAITNPVFANPALQQAEQRLNQEGERNRVLNHLRSGTVALDIGNPQKAGEHFDQALQRITAIYANDEKAKRARSLWVSEGTKDYIGEPYERVMAFYYRGLIDLMNADYENARASFKSGQLQDAYAEENQNRADFASLLFLEGWASHLNGDRGLANEAWAEVKTLRPDFTPPAGNHSMLILAESGKSPRKLADGIAQNLLVYRRGKRFKEARVKVLSGAPIATLYPIEDIFWQASTRGGRPFDDILDGQVRFKKNTDNIGTVLTDTATTAANVTSYLTGADTSTGVFGAMQLAGTLALAFSSGARTEADVRYWDNLSDALHISTLPASQLEPEVTVEYLTAKENRLRKPITKTARVHYDRRGNGLLWVRSRPASDYK